MDSDKKSDESSSDFTDSEDNLPVKHLKPNKPENSTEIVNTDDPDAERLDLKMTVETAEDSDDENETLNVKSNLFKNMTYLSVKIKKPNFSDAKRKPSNCDSTHNSGSEVSSSDTDGEIKGMQTQPITHRNQYFKKFKFGPPTKLPDIMLPEGFGEPIAVVPIKQVRLFIIRRTNYLY